MCSGPGTMPGLYNLPRIDAPPAPPPNGAGGAAYFQLPPGAILLDAPPVRGLDFAALVARAARRARRQFARAHRGKLLIAKEGGNGAKGYLIPQNGRVKGQIDQERITYRTRAIRATKRDAVRAAREKARMASKYDGEPNADALSAHGGLDKEALRYATRFQPGSLHLNQARGRADAARDTFEAHSVTDLEKEMFGAARRLQRAFAAEWRTWTSDRAVTLQRHARTHIVRTVLQAHADRVDECARLARSFYARRILVSWGRRVLVAWHLVATRRFFFRLFLIKTRRALCRLRAARIFRTWAGRACSPTARAWRTRYYQLRLYGLQSRRNRLQKHLDGWGAVSRAQRLLRRCVGARAGRCFQAWRRLTPWLKVEPQAQAIQQWYGRLQQNWADLGAARAVCALVRSRRLMQTVVADRGRHAAARKVQGEWRHFKAKKDAQMHRREDAAATEVQRAARGVLARQRVARKRYCESTAARLLKRCAALRIQNWWTGRVLARDPLDFAVLESHLIRAAAHREAAEREMEEELADLFWAEERLDEKDAAWWWSLYLPKDPPRSEADRARERTQSIRRARKEAERQTALAKEAKQDRIARRKAKHRRWVLYGKQKQQRPVASGAPPKNTSLFAEKAKAPVDSDNDTRLSKRGNKEQMKEKAKGKEGITYSKKRARELRQKMLRRAPLPDPGYSVFY